MNGSSRRRCAVTAAPAVGARAAAAARTLREEDRLLGLLEGPHAVAKIEGETALVFGRSKGVSLRVGSVPAAAARRLASAGAVSCAPGRRDTFVLTEAGRARLRRTAAGAADAFATQHGARVAAPALAAAEGAVQLNSAESPLLWLHRRKGAGGGPALIGDMEFAAGERLRSDLTLAQLMPRLGADWERGPGGGVAVGLAPSDMRMAAQQRVDRAMAAVGPDLSGLLIDVCGFLKSIEMVERERGWPARSAKVALHLALAALARHYGLSAVAVGVARGGARHAWSAPDAAGAFSAEG